MQVCMCTLSYYICLSYLNHVLTSHDDSKHSFHSFTARSAKRIAMTMKMRGNVRGVANGSIQVAQGVKAAQGPGVRERAGSCK